MRSVPGRLCEPELLETPCIVTGDSLVGTFSQQAARTGDPLSLALTTQTREKPLNHAEPRVSVGTTVQVRWLPF